MQKGIPLLGIDNTNVKLWEMRRYVEEAQQYQYAVDIKQPET